MRKRILSAALLISAPAIASETFNFLPPEVMKALGQVKVLSQSIKEDGFMPSILIEIRNDSDFHFQMLEISCSLHKEGKLVDKTQAYFMNVAPAETASETALYEMTKNTVGADKVSCRASLGM
ncbi:hypothetical protein ACLBWS_02975 [Brucellaceae bacterium D45D]